MDENIFTFNGKKAHELVLLYTIDILDKDYKDEYFIVDDNVNTVARWVDIDEFKNGNKILYPDGIFKYL